MKSKTANSYPTNEALALAQAIYRANGNRINKDVIGTDGAVVPGNKLQMLNHYREQVTVEVTEQDRDQAQETLNYIQQRLLMNTITGRESNDFINNVAGSIQGETVSERMFGYLVWAPKVAQQMQEDDSKKNDISLYALSSNYRGRIGEKLDLNWTAIDIRFNREYNCFRHTGIDEYKNLVTFFNKVQIPNGQIRARVKGQQHSSFLGGKVTSLNYVRSINGT